MYLIRRWRNALVAAFLILALLATERRAESYGDTLQVVLPVAALGCSIVTGQAVEYVARYVGMWLSLHAMRQVVPPPISDRPRGGGFGFPSGHTTSSAFGASALVFTCIEGAPLLKVAIVLGAGLTAGSRIEVGAHDIWQVFAGALLAVLWERGLRRPGPLRTRLAGLFQRQRRST